jgi:hypothetical protein
VQKKRGQINLHLPPSAPNTQEYGVIVDLATKPIRIYLAEDFTQLDLKTLHFLKLNAREVHIVRLSFIFMPF